MKFRTKLIVGFSFVIFIISAILGIVCYQYNSRRITEISRQNLEFYSRQLADSIDATVDTMKQVTDYILSDPDMLYAMQSMPKYHENGNDTERKNQISVLTTGISMDYINRNFYRAIIFNELGDVASSNNTGDMIISKGRDVSRIDWLEKAEKLHGKVLLIGPHEDGWSVRKSAQVFALGRKVQGGNFGYIEVQNNVEKLDTIFQLPDSSVLVGAWLPDGSLLYRTKGLKNKELDKYLEQGEEGEVKTVHTNGKEQILATATSQNYGIHVAAIQNSGSMLQDLKQSLILAGALALGCFVVSMSMVVIIASKLSSPITNLREQMENTGIENLDTEPITVDADDEMEALARAYRQLMNRLNESIIKEKRLSLLQLQAQFDTLQAQVNPHFLYNVLNVISNRGIVSGDEEICEICGSLAAMLRYSTNTKERYATVKEEVEYLKKYIFLLKSRYEHRLEVEVTCEAQIENEVMPKIVLQQLVENSVEHGFVNSMSVMRIHVHGWKDEKGWFFEVRDNGQGITEDVKKDLEDKIEKIKNKILRKRSNIEMEIGGMGIANTYARMFLLYADSTVFTMKNMDEGLSITIGVRRKDDELCIE